jgi:hypothetical protein
MRYNGIRIGEKIKSLGHHFTFEDGGLKDET